ncbi:MAG: hypothetical protein GU356_12035 [Pyrobaculum sp.]|jgi:hypothetical protein|nr:hypothetical protein [Pyrobaculum sp.]
MQFVINGVKYWIMLGPSGLTLYKKEGSKTKYLGRRSIAEIKEMLAKADAEAVQRIKAELETVKQAVESQKPPQTAQTAQTPSLIWKKDGHTYWILQYGTSFYTYVKGPSTKHRPKLVEKTDVTGAIDRLVAAGALHVLEALRLLINGLHAAVSDLQRPPAEAREDSKKPQAESTSDGAQRAPQASRREAEAALRELKSALRRAVERWGEEWRMKTRGLEEPDAEWLKKKLMDFIGAYIHLLEKIQPYEDLLDKFADAVVEAAAGRLTRSNALEILK